MSWRCLVRGALCPSDEAAGAFIRTPEAMVALMLEHAKSDAKGSFQYDGNTEELFLQFLQRHNYELSIKATRYDIRVLGLHIREAKLSGGPEVYDMAVGQTYRFQCGLMNELTRSCYSEGTMRAMDAYPMGGLYSG